MSVVLLLDCFDFGLGVLRGVGVIGNSIILVVMLEASLNYFYVIVLHCIR